MLGIPSGVYNVLDLTADSLLEYPSHVTNKVTIIESNLSRKDTLAQTNKRAVNVKRKIVFVTECDAPFRDEVPKPRYHAN